ncbi:hyaluronidase-2 [Pangasianodon hypophthalmus]|uniref:hyaluronidase-2 n=1 Tax=Pangasianodon hypophthalmus TaxID=310915 RepID=UPI0023081CE5|nr:hyaluronidase-2 [Pangasianodon hypophthalmus]
MANWFLSKWKLWLLVPLVLDSFTDAQDLKPTRWPLYQGKPLLLAWNAPTEDCRPRHDVHFQLDQFQIVASPNEGFTKQNLTIFYKDRLGLYPYFNSDNNPVNGGLPQIASLTQHLEKMPQDIVRYIHNPAAKGLAVIDWEEWRPLWIRNWDTKNIYRNQSRLLVSKKNPTWDQIQVNKVAQQEFEISGRTFMLKSLQLAKSLRPNQLWGFYLFPDCYNHDYLKSLESYTGRCPDPEIARNDQLRWLWTDSTALFPSVYIGSVLRSTAFARQFVRNRVKEGMRVASLGSDLARPVFVYVRPTYVNELELLTEIDLVSTIGESVALGAAGIILWGDASYASSSASCSSLAEYVRGPLGHYLLNVSSAAEQCSHSVCGSHGRCLRRHPDSDSYLHLDPQNHRIVVQGKRLAVEGHMGTEELKRMRHDFICQCFRGYQGYNCELQDPQYNKGQRHKLHVSWSCCLLFLLLTLLN